MTTMRQLLVVLLLSTGSLLGCAHQAAVQEPAPRLVGGDRDAHGCLPSAGYSWCAKEASCVRSWELAKEKHFDNTPEAYEQYCLSESK